MKRPGDSFVRRVLVLVLLLGLCAGCRSGSSASKAVPTGSSAVSTPSASAVVSPPAGGDYADAVRAAVRHGLRVWLESDLVKRWQEGPASFSRSMTQLGSLAATHGVVGIKIADELGYHDGLSTPAEIRQFLTAASAALNRVAPGKRLLVDMIVPELGCLPDQSPPLLWPTECVVKSRGRYPQLTLDSVTSYLRLKAVSVLDLSTGLLSDSTYAGWGVDLDIAQNAAWAKVKRLGWASLVTIHARKALAHPGAYTKLSAEAAADVRTWVDIPLADGAGAVDIWTWRQMYKGSINRILNPGLQPNALWTALRARRARGDELFTHLSPHSLEVGLDADLTVLAQVFSDAFVAAGTG